MAMACPGDERTFVAGEIDRKGCNFFGAPIRPIGWRAMKAAGGRPVLGIASALPCAPEARGFRPCGADRVAADALGHEVGRDRFGDADHRGLGRAVDEAVGGGDDRGGDRGDEDDRCRRPRRSSRAGRRGSRVERLHVQVDREVERRLVAVHDRAVVDIARAVEQDVGRARVRRWRLPPRHRSRRAGASRSPRRRAAQRLGRHVGRDHARAFARKGPPWQGRSPRPPPCRTPFSL
jgi:hypothetical protein